MNKTVRDVGLSGLNMLGTNRVLLRAKRSSPLALCYHGVTSNVGAEFVENRNVTSEAFDRQLNRLKRHCDVVDLPDFLEVVRRPRKRKRRVVTITFDDGYENNLTCAVPILEAHGVSACFFLTTGPIRDGCWLDHDLRELSVRFSRNTWEARVGDKTWVIAHDAAAATRQMIGREIKRAMSFLPWKEYVQLVHEFYERTGRPEPPAEYAQFYRPLSTGQARELVSRGMYVGSHTETHPKLDELSDQQLQRELRRAAVWIQENLGVPIEQQPVAYPKGCYDERVMACCKDLGHLAGFAVAVPWKAAPEHLFDLPRIGVDRGNSDAMFAGQLSGLVPLLRRLRRLSQARQSCRRPGSRG